jgi:hypothetical protein
VILGIKEPFDAFCVDEAVTEFGFWVTNQLDEIKGKNQKKVQGQRDALLRRLLADDPEQRFRTPTATK